MTIVVDPDYRRLIAAYGHQLEDVAGLLRTANHELVRIARELAKEGACQDVGHLHAVQSILEWAEEVLQDFPKYWGEQVED